MDTPCILWQKAKDREGYGFLNLAGRQVKAHRLAYANANGLDVHSMGGVVLHLCDTPSCVNPEHLRLGTHVDNMEDMKAKGRQPQGEAKKLSKLTLLQVINCRARYKKGCPVNGASAMARTLGVSISTLCKALRGDTWR